MNVKRSWVRRRRGYMLIEAILYHLLIITLMVASLQTLKLLRMSETACEQNTLMQREIRRFAEDLRSDVRRSTVTSISSDSLDLSMPSGPIRYRTIPDGIERIAETTPVQRERYFFTTTYRASFDVQGDVAVSSVIQSSDGGEQPVFEIYAQRESR